MGAKHGARSNNWGKSRYGPYTAPYRSQEWKKDSDLRSKYGITLAEYYHVLQTQNFGCKICGKTAEENGKNLAVDHDHSCCPGKKACGNCNRGLLCQSCNQGIGHFNDDPELLARAISYVLEGKNG